MGNQKYWLEVHWPRARGEQSRQQGKAKTMWMYFHTDKEHKDREVQKGDRVLFYETRVHPDKGWRGAETVFALGVVKGYKGVPNPPPNVSGGKTWRLRREVTAKVLPPAAGIPMPEIRKALKWGKRATLRRSPMKLEPDQYQRLVRLFDHSEKRQQVRTSRAVRIPKQHDPMLRAKIERLAIEAAIKWYEAKGYDVNSVEKDNLGWDLEATSPGHTLKVEVKGLSGPRVVVGLTPNEYRSMRRSTARQVYRLFVVVDVLGKLKAEEFQFNKKAGLWEGERGEPLNIREIVAAIASK